MKRPREILHQLETSQSEINKELEKELWTRSRNARRRVEKAIDMSSFLISDDMGETLSSFETQMGQALDIHEDWADVIGAE